MLLLGLRCSGFLGCSRLNLVVLVVGVWQCGLFVGVYVVVSLVFIAVGWVVLCSLACLLIVLVVVFEFG